MGAVTVVLRKRRHDMSYVVADITMAASYATNGDTYTLAQFEAGNAIDAIVFSGNPSGYQFEADLTNKKIKVRQGDNTNAAAAPGSEVPNTTNLSAITVRALVYRDYPGI